MNKYMKLAVKEAQSGIRRGHGGPFGCVIVKRDEHGEEAVLSKGHNQVLLKHDPTCHGEMQAIRRACAKLGTHNLAGCELYTTGEPCPMCLGAILWANIDKVYYGCNIEDTEIIGFRDKKFYGMTAEEKQAFIKELDRDACLALYEEYRSIEGKINY